MTDITEKYAAMVKLLGKPGAVILETLTPEKAHLWHMATGIAGETGELLETTLKPYSTVDVIEELGDIAFYLEGLRQGLCVDAALQPSCFSGGVEHASYLHRITEIAVNGAAILDLVKKHVIYNKDLGIIDLYCVMGALEYNMQELTKDIPSTREAVLEANYQKLMTKRYPNGYSDAAAQARADKLC